MLHTLTHIYILHFGFTQLQELNCLQFVLPCAYEFISVVFAHSLYTYVCLLQEPEQTQEDEEKEGPAQKRPRMEVEADVTEERKLTSSPSPSQIRSPSSSRIVKCNSSGHRVEGGIDRVKSSRIDTGSFSKVPPELFHHILKFLSSEVWCSLFFFHSYIIDVDVI